MANEIYHSVGRRKNAVARVYITEGSGKITVNNRALEDYFLRPTSRMMVEHAIGLSNNQGKFDIKVNVVGGGLSGQAGAIRHGIVKAIMQVQPEIRPTFKQAGLITRDSRIKERKKFGLASARARFQFSKR